jgi:hypothetical protein|tara:strand:- start:15641 stop:16213 length:573 start_codon:yes stop_codon:yes gene_type:complete
MASGHQACALFTGTCSGHGRGNGVTWQPGPGGGFVSPCPHSSLQETIVNKRVPFVNNFATWPPHPQRPRDPQSGGNDPFNRTVIVNDLVPIIDQDDLITHPTPTMFTTISIGFKCLTVRSTPAWHCTTGVGGNGREPSVGHNRRLFATCKTVFIEGMRAGRFADPFGNNTVPFDCLSVVSGSSPNVFIGS